MAAARNPRVKECPLEGCVLDHTALGQGRIHSFVCLFLYIFFLSFFLSFCLFFFLSFFLFLRSFLFFCLFVCLFVGLAACLVWILSGVTLCNASRYMKDSQFMQRMNALMGMSGAEPGCQLQVACAKELSTVNMWKVPWDHWKSKCWCSSSRRTLAATDVMSCSELCPTLVWLHLPKTFCLFAVVSFSWNPKRTSEFLRRGKMSKITIFSAFLAKAFFR